jgi:hypothetical protein
MNLKARTFAAVRDGVDGEMERLVAQEPGAVRHALGLSYNEEPLIRRRAARAVALASRSHPAMVLNVIRRLVWAMNDESGTNAATSPEVLQAIADEMPELLFPMLPDLVRLSADPELHEGLVVVLRTVSRRCPGELGRQLEKSIHERIGSCGCGHSDIV